MFCFPKDVPGWLYEEEGRRLYELAHSKIVLELGSYLGLSTICIAQSARRVYCIDSFLCTNTPIPEDGISDTLPSFEDNIGRYNLLTRVFPYRGLFGEVLPKFTEKLEETFDLIFIDGSHDYESVCEDIRLVIPYLKLPGYIAFHDYGKNEFPGVTKAVDEYFKVSEVVRSLAICRIE